MTQKKLEELKIELEKIKSCSIQFGFQCQEIANDIEVVIGKRVSAQTIRRICGLLPYDGKLRGFTYGALMEYIDKKKSLINIATPNSSHQNSEILLLLQSLSEAMRHCPPALQKKLHLRFLQSLYRNIQFLEAELLNALQQKEFVQWWWNYLPPIDGLNGSSKTWILPLINISASPDRKAFFESFILQNSLLTNGSVQISPSLLSQSQRISADHPPMYIGRMYMIQIWSLLNEGQKNLDEYLVDKIDQWKNKEMGICSMIQWQVVESLALMNQFHWAKKIAQLPTIENLPLEDFSKEVVSFWKMMIEMIERKSALKNQHSITAYQSHLFFAPNYYELLFTQVVLQSKYLRDFHEEKYLQKRDALLKATGYAHLMNWPVQE